MIFVFCSTEYAWRLSSFHYSGMFYWNQHVLYRLLYHFVSFYWIRLSITHCHYSDGGVKPRSSWSCTFDAVVELTQQHVLLFFVMSDCQHLKKTQITRPLLANTLRRRCFMSLATFSVVLFILGVTVTVFQNLFSSSSRPTIRVNTCRNGFSVTEIGTQIGSSPFVPTATVPMLLPPLVNGGVVVLSPYVSWPRWCSWFWADSLTLPKPLSITWLICLTCTSCSDAAVVQRLLW
jgi:hypothetical protein